MNENLDLTKILEGCPIGTEFYSSAFGNLTFVKITLFNTITMMNTRCQYSYLNDGRLYYGVGECTLFPSKDQRDWSKFVRFWDELKEKFDPHTLRPFDRVLVRNSNNLIWQCNVFSHLKQCAGNKLVHTFFSCVNGLWNTCIPYNDETKHLCGTTDDCPEYYKWWEE